MREILRDPMRLEHIKDSIDKLLDADSMINLDFITETDLQYFGIIKLLEIIG